MLISRIWVWAYTSSNLHDEPTGFISLGFNASRVKLEDELEFALQVHKLSVVFTSFQVCLEVDVYLNPSSNTSNPPAASPAGKAYRVIDSDKDGKAPFLQSAMMKG